MSHSYTIESVGPPAEWSNSHGTFYEYGLELSGETETVSWSRKKDSDPPKIGDVIWGDITNGPKGPKIKIDWEAMKNNKGTPAAPSPTKSAGETPDNRQASIVRQVALKILAPSINEAGGLTASLKAKAEEIERFVMAASQTPQEPSSAVPAHSKEKDLKDLHELLEGAGLHYEAARVVTNYVNDQFSPEQRDTAIRRLNDPNQAQGALAKLKELSETHNGEPLPADVADPADDPIPF